MLLDTRPHKCNQRGNRSTKCAGVRTVEFDLGRDAVRPRIPRESRGLLDKLTERGLDLSRLLNSKDLSGHAN